MVAFSLVLFLWPHYIVYLFTSQPGLIEMTSTFLRIEIAGYLMLGLYFGLQQSINGAGDTVPPMLVTLVNMWGVQLPLAYFLQRLTNLGVYGVPWAIAIGTIVGAFVFTIYFRLGRWKRKKV